MSTEETCSHLRELVRQFTPSDGTPLKNDAARCIVNTAQIAIRLAEELIVKQNHIYRLTGLLKHSDTCITEEQFQAGMVCNCGVYEAMRSYDMDMEKLKAARQ